MNNCEWVINYDYVGISEDDTKMIKIFDDFMVNQLSELIHDSWNQYYEEFKDDYDDDGDMI